MCDSLIELFHEGKMMSISGTPAISDRSEKGDIVKVPSLLLSRQRSIRRRAVHFFVLHSQAEKALADHDHSSGEAITRARHDMETWDSRTGKAFAVMTCTDNAIAKESPEGSHSERWRCWGKAWLFVRFDNTVGH
jgi:hypothetical protein